MTKRGQDQGSLLVSQVTGAPRQVQSWGDFWHDFTARFSPARGKRKERTK
jgi:hypothetical protein